MQQLIDLLPLIAFLVSYKLGGIYVATGVLIGTCGLQIGWHWWRTRKIKTLHWVTALLVLLFGSATLIFHDPKFIQWKPSVLMWLLGTAFLLSQFIGRKPLSRRFLESLVASAVESQPSAADNTGAPPSHPTLSDPQWQLLNWAWVLFFILAGAANLYVARHFSEQTWVYFKVGGLFLLTLLFVMPQLVWLMPKEHKSPGTTE